MSVPDDAMPDYYRLLLGEEVPNVRRSKRKIEPWRAGLLLDGAEAAKGAEERFDQVHVRHRSRMTSPRSSWGM